VVIRYLLAALLAFAIPAASWAEPIPDGTNSGYRNAPGYTGILTDGSSLSVTSGSAGNPHIYKFYSFNGPFSIPAGVHNVVMYGCSFKSNHSGIIGSAGADGHNVTDAGVDIIFDYNTFAPTTPASPPALPAQLDCRTQSYEYGILQQPNASPQAQGEATYHNEFWGYGNALTPDNNDGTSGHPYISMNNWFHDAAPDGQYQCGGDTSGGYHTDGIGETSPDGKVIKGGYFDNNQLNTWGNSPIAWQMGGNDNPAGAYENIA